MPLAGIGITSGWELVMHSSTSILRYAVSDLKQECSTSQAYCVFASAFGSQTGMKTNVINCLYFQQLHKD
jgi:hypothetical protein